MPEVTSEAPIEGLPDPFAPPPLPADASAGDDAMSHGASSSSSGGGPSAPLPEGPVDGQVPGGYIIGGTFVQHVEPSARPPNVLPFHMEELEQGEEKGGHTDLGTDCCRRHRPSREIPSST